MTEENERSRTHDFKIFENKIVSFKKPNGEVVEENFVVQGTYDEIRTNGVWLKVGIDFLRAWLPLDQ